MENKEITADGITYTVIKMLAKGKGGYSYLAKSGDFLVVVKKIHYEPCDYFQFEDDKLISELRDYETLSRLDIPVPELISYNSEEQYLIKEYISGRTLAQIVADGQIDDDYIAQIFKMCDILYQNNLNIDYFPTNFVVGQRLLYYIDFECSQYSDEWNFENWGIWFLANQSGMRNFLDTGDYSTILDNGKPIHSGFEDTVARWLSQR